MEGIHKMKWRKILAITALLSVLTATPAFSLEYSLAGAAEASFGTPTSDETIYVGTQETGNIDRSKNSAQIPPGFGTPTSYLPGSGEYLTPNLAASGSTVKAVNPSAGAAVSVSNIGTAGIGSSENLSMPTAPNRNTSISYADSRSYINHTGYTEVDSSLYYADGYLGWLKIPAIDVNTKVYQGTDSGTLAKGAGHFTNTSIWDGNVGIAAHNRGVNNLFDKLHKLAIGDKITLTTKLGTRNYTVTSVEKISDTDNSLLTSTTENCLTLFTCVRNESSYRWAVRAVEI